MKHGKHMPLFWMKCKLFSLLILNLSIPTFGIAMSTTGKNGSNEKLRVVQAGFIKQKGEN